MTQRERLTAVARGGDVDRCPVVLVGQWDDRADACAVPLADLRIGQDAACLALVLSPFARAVSKGLDLNQDLHDHPERGNAELDELAREASAEMATALDRGADGVFYVLEGACAKQCTPMQYGGHYLERDRELMAQVQDARFNLIFVEGREDVYLDSVSDLPADALGWHLAESGFTLGQMRQVRQGALASFFEGSEVRLVASVPELEDVLRREESAEVPA